MSRETEAFVLNIKELSRLSLADRLKKYSDKFQEKEDLNDWDHPQEGVEICLVAMTSRGAVPVGYGKITEVNYFSGKVESIMLLGETELVSVINFDNETKIALVLEDTKREQLYTSMEKRISKAYYLTEETVNTILQALWL
jgi:hypothetical protein